MDLIVADGGPVIIDVNPRLVEPANALAAGVDLVAAMLDVAGDAPAQQRSSGGAGVRTRQTLLAILGAAEQHGTRGAVLREAFDAIFVRGDYAGAVEELTPIAGDPVAAVPVVAALVAFTDPPAIVAEISRWRGRPLRGHAGSVERDSGGGGLTSTSGTFVTCRTVTVFP
jgi:hypothetical protein